MGVDGHLKMKNSVPELEKVRVDDDIRNCKTCILGKIQKLPLRGENKGYTTTTTSTH